jgi:hypothetical protein
MKMKFTDGGAHQREAVDIEASQGMTGVLVSKVKVLGSP